MNHIKSITNEKESFFVQTNERTEHFATKDAAQLFISLHTDPIRKGTGVEKLLTTNAYL